MATLPFSVAAGLIVGNWRGCAAWWLGWMACVMGRRVAQFIDSAYQSETKGDANG